MDTLMDRPAASPGDGRGEGTVSGASSGQPGGPASAEKTGKSDVELLAADGTRVPIENVREKALRSGRQAGRYANDSWKKMRRSAEELGKTNPTGLALGSLAVGLVAGAVLGALLSRD
ncbi:MAG TPA: hypothetical protein VGH97_07935 [Thermoanaerobaculia bacterium]|jgi:hypothetical protein